ncbi:MAG TPA: ScyD/ScyE family protein [Vicinamibacterales bacterium]|nr:ScyD/ScyE family protein [Vicinamibacterales bacterium]
MPPEREECMSRERLIRNAQKISVPGTAVRAAWLLVVFMGGFGQDAAAQACPGVTLATGLRVPLGVTLSNEGNLIVSESGTAAVHSGRISILAPNGTRRTLLDGLPSGLNDVGEPSGPAGIIMRGRTAYVLIGVGDSVLAGPIPTTHLPNPAVSSPVYSSVLAIHFSANVEKNTAGFVLSLADQAALADGETVILSNGRGDTIEIELVTNFPNYVPAPQPGFPALVRASNPFSVALAGNDLYVTDGSRNLVWAVDIPTGAHAALVEFPPVANPLFGVPGVPGGPTVEAVPTGIALADRQLLVALFRGVPFPPGTSTIMQVDPSTGGQAAFISGLKTAIGVIQTKDRGDVGYLVLQHSSGLGPFFGGPGVVLGFDSAGPSPAVLANCLTRPSSMVLDEKAGILYVAEIGGRVVALSIGS